MATYKSRKELEGNTLAEGDTVMFGELWYEVYPNWLSNVNGFNGVVFEELECDKIGLASKCYGYQPVNMGWPWCEENDYPALTRFVLALYELWEVKFIRTIYYTVTEEQYDDGGGANGLITLRLYEVKNNRIAFVAEIAVDTDSPYNYPEEIQEWWIDNENDEEINIERLY